MFVHHKCVDCFEFCVRCVQSNHNLDNLKNRFYLNQSSKSKDVLNARTFVKISANVLGMSKKNKI